MTPSSEAQITPMEFAQVRERYQKRLSEIEAECLELRQALGISAVSQYGAGTVDGLIISAVGELGSAGAREVAERIGRRPHSIACRMSYLSLMGRIVRKKRGVYELPQEEGEI